ncbi:MAG: hypothetical protein EXS05_22415 [Planctomycetaceae bacterium]|nr:hypothetical protein [Planctomycetaceae bacterium]
MTTANSLTKSAAPFAVAIERPPAGGRLGPRRASRAIALAGVVAMIAGGLTGCATSLFEKSLLDNKVSIRNVFGTTGKKALDAVEMSQRDPSTPPEGSEELEAAKIIYDQKDYAAARKAYNKIAKNKKYKDLPAREEALFMVAECDFQRQYFADAQDGYDELLNEGSPRYVEQATQRLMAIARYWLNSPKNPSEVELAHFEQADPQTKLEDMPDAQVAFSFPLTPNLFDKTRPLFDTQGRALQALRSIWTKDSQGPLADDALLLAATYHLRKRDYESADHNFATIRELYGEREHAATAFILGQHASYQSYQGPRYDGKQLEEARKLTDSTLRLYPDAPQTKKLKADKERMRMEIAERDWTRVQYHLKRAGEKDSAAVYAEYIILQHPDSPRAAEARKLLLELGPEYAQGILPTSLFKAPSMPIEEYGGGPDDAPPGADPEPPARVFVSDNAEPISGNK